jgi:hypothetical protein
MRTHTRTPHALMQTRTIPSDGSPPARRPSPVLLVVRGILILAVVLGTLGAEAAQSAGYVSAGRAGAYQAAGDVRAPAGAYRVSTRPAIDAPWMY